MFERRTSLETMRSDLPESLRVAKAMCDFGLPLSKGSMRSLNQIGGFKLTRRTETSQYPEERTSTETPLVVASERGSGQWPFVKNQNCLERQTRVGESPVWVETQKVLE